MADRRSCAFWKTLRSLPSPMMVEMPFGVRPLALLQHITRIAVGSCYITNYVLSSSLGGRGRSTNATPHAERRRAIERSNASTIQYNCTRLICRARFAGDLVIEWFLQPLNRYRGAWHTSVACCRVSGFVIMDIFIQLAIRYVHLTHDGHRVSVVYSYHGRYTRDRLAIVSR